MFATLTLPAGNDLTLPQPTPTVRVRSADDLRNALRHARAQSVKLDGSEMDRVLHLDTKRGILELQAATPWAELARVLAARKIDISAFARTAGVPATVGEAVAQAAAGPDGLPVSAHVAAMPECAIECLLPPAALDAYLQDVRALIEERRVALHGITVRRYQAESETSLRWATREWAGVEIRFGSKTTLGAAVAAAEIRRALLAAALAHGGSFPIRDLRDATRRQLETCYPMLQAFLADKRRGDPAERLHNAWYRALVATMRGESCQVRWGS